MTITDPATSASPGSTRWRQDTRTRRSSREFLAEAVAIQVADYESDTGAIRIRGKENRERTVYVLPGWAAAPPPRTVKELGGSEQVSG